MHCHSVICIINLTSNHLLTSSNFTLSCAAVIIDLGLIHAWCNYKFCLNVPMLPCFLLQYKAEESVTLWVNKVGPYNNPQETYNYYSLPFCHQSENAAHKWGGLGEVLGGNELIDSQIVIKFQSMWTSMLCYNFCWWIVVFNCNLICFISLFRKCGQGYHLPTWTWRSKG